MKMYRQHKQNAVIIQVETLPFLTSITIAQNFKKRIVHFGVAQIMSAILHNFCFIILNIEYE